MAEMLGPNWLESVFSFVEHWEVVHIEFEAHALRQGRAMFFFFNPVIELINSIAANCTMAAVRRMYLSACETVS